MMDYKEAMSELKKLGTDQNIKIYKRHGAGDKLFGVSFANLDKLKKKIKIDHDLALKLWESANTDARTLATMIADPQKLNSATLNRWINDVQYYLLADLLAGLTVRTWFTINTMTQWMKSKKEYVRQGGYAVLASALRDNHEISDADCRKYLQVIQKEIHTSPNRARHTMNNALIAIGIYRERLTEDAIETAKNIGKVEVDHGETSCKTQDAIQYIQKALNRKKSKH
jgi:3-methyladenine DNA glycosylase AlkD